MTASAADVQRLLSRSCEELIVAARAHRVTVRIDCPVLDLEVNRVAAEAVAPGTAPIAGDSSLPQRDLLTIHWLERMRTLLVQETPSTPPGIPDQLREAYGVNSQMLGPLECRGRLQGWISVHRSDVGEWRNPEIRALATTAAKVSRGLGWVRPAWTATVLSAPDTSPDSSNHIKKEIP